MKTVKISNYTGIKIVIDDAALPGRAIVPCAGTLVCCSETARKIESDWSEINKLIISPALIGSIKFGY